MSKNIDLGYSSFALLFMIIRLITFFEDLKKWIFSFIWEISKNKFLSSIKSKFIELVSLFNKEETLKKLSSFLYFHKFKSEAKSTGFEVREEIFLEILN